MSYTLIHLHTQHSLLDGFSDVDDVAKRAKELGLKNVGVSDHGNVFAHVAFHEACRKHDIKPILGSELYISYTPAPLKNDRKNSHMVVCAMNKQGLKDLWELSSLTWSPEYFYYKPRIQLENFEDENNKLWLGLEAFTRKGNIFGISGHMGSLLSDNLFADLFGDDKKRTEAIRQAYNKCTITDLEYYTKFLKPNWLEDTCKLAERLNNIFSRNFRIELQDESSIYNGTPSLWICKLIVECLREVSKCTGIKAMASSDPHYARKEDAVCQRNMLMISMKETEESIREKIEAEDDMLVFFSSDNFYIKSYEEMAEKFTKEELEETNIVASLIEDYEIKEKPVLPVFPIPEFPKDAAWLKWIEKDVDKYVFYLAVQGIRKLKPWEKSGIDKEKYWERLKQECKVFFEAGLSNYFLLVRDICIYADSKNIPRGDGRGSAAGCLLSFCLGITGENCDPVKNGLSFARFYNAGRNTKNNISLPDIDLDFGTKGRDDIIEYVKNKWGHDNVTQIITFGRIQGRAGVKDIFRIKGIENYFEKANKICEHIPDEAKIADELQEVRDTGEDYSILEWCLDHSEKVQEFYKDVTFKEVIDEAIKIEGTYRNSGKHASGIVVTPKPSKEHFPMALDVKTKQPIAAVDMRDVEKLGGVKIDILGITLLDKLKYCEDLVNEVVN